MIKQHANRSTNVTRHCTARCPTFCDAQRQPPPALYRTFSGRMTFVPHNYTKSNVSRYTSSYAVKDLDPAEIAAGPLSSEGHANLQLVTGKRGPSFKTGDRHDYQRVVQDHKRHNLEALDKVRPLKKQRSVKMGKAAVEVVGKKY